MIVILLSFLQLNFSHITANTIRHLLYYPPYRPIILSYLAQRIKEAREERMGLKGDKVISYAFIRLILQPLRRERNRDRMDL